MKAKLLGSDRKGLGIGIGLRLGIRIADLNQIADLKLSILAPVTSDRRSEPNTVLIINRRERTYTDHTDLEAVRT